MGRSCDVARGIDINMGLGSGAFSRLWSKIIGQKKGVFRFRTGAAPFLFIGCVHDGNVQNTCKQRLRCVQNVQNT
jgi:hypothetical protein